MTRLAVILIAILCALGAMACGDAAGDRRPNRIPAGDEKVGRANVSWVGTFTNGQKQLMRDAIHFHQLMFKKKARRDAPFVWLRVGPVSAWKFGTVQHNGGRSDTSPDRTTIECDPGPFLTLHNYYHEMFHVVNHDRFHLTLPRTWNRVDQQAASNRSLIQSGVKVP